MRDNFVALDVLDRLRSSGERPSAADRAVLDGWHGWGAAPQLFDRPEFQTERERLRERLGPSGYDAAKRTTLNAHYTDPRLIDAMWDGVQAFGLSGGVFLEPGSGRGSFLHYAPESFAGVGVELDPTTAAVAGALSDRRHRVIAGDFGKVRLNAGSVDAVVGNVPFGQYAIFDPEYNAARRHSIHDHFLIKSLATLAPGGVAVVLSSRYTLDKRDTLARREMGEHADFLGAVRLPSKSHEVEAGTNVVTDVLVFRARESNAMPTHAAGFLDPVETLNISSSEQDDRLFASAYFAQHPDQLLGQVRIASGPYGPQLLVDSDAAVGAGLSDALARIVADAGVVAAPEHATHEVELVLLREALFEAPFGRIEASLGGFRRYGEQGWEHHDAGKHTRELARLIELRDLARSLVDLEAVAPMGDAGVEARRTELADAYQRFAARFGAINQVKISEATGRRTAPRWGGFRSDPDWPRVAALELYDESSGSSRPASLLQHRVVVPTAAPTHADSPEDALSISMAERGRVDLALIAELLEIEEQQCLATLGARVFVDPADERVVIASEYLSGNVRKKLAAAALAAEAEPAFVRNVEALSDVLPREVVASELEGVLGAPWVPTETIAAFARHLAPSGSPREEIKVMRGESTNEWIVEAPRAVRERMREGHTFGTSAKNALELLEIGLNGRTPIVTVENVDGQRVVDTEATAIACDRAVELKDEFDRWLLRDDPERAAAMLGIYNERFNSYVARSYTGAKIAAPGLASDFSLRAHQEQAIARIIFGGNTALWHPVGAGKSAEMIVGGMEMRRLGMIRRPAYVVPNHMLEQFASDIMQLYPAAQVLTVEKDAVSPKERHLFAARTRSHDWDAVVITHSSFVRWQLSPAAEEEIIAAKIGEYRDELARLATSDGDVRTLTKKIEKSIANYEGKLDANRARIASHQDAHDFPFDHSGIDYLFVDEADEFKNGELISLARNLRGVPVGDGSQRANELDAKLRWMRSRYPERQSTHATGTPVSNTVAELWVSARYLRPDLLEEYGVQSFDAFRAVFCDTTSDMELDLARSFRRVERLSRYKNLPELARLMGEFADIVNVENLGLPRPELATGSRQVVVVPPSRQLEEFISLEVRARVEAIRSGRVDPSLDNMLKLSSECRMASFDWETYSGVPVPDEHSTLAAAARTIGAIYRENASRVYASEIGTPHPRTGAFQLVFSDLGTPKPGQFDTAYERLRELLVTEGVPREKVRFIHEHDGNDEEKARFFSACRDGRIAVAIASTMKMGMGTNVQDRLIAGHHLDVPWRPRDVEQREGRWMRQGNQNAIVSSYAYLAERSFAVYGWQTLERKAGFVGQLLRAEPDGPRILEVHDDEALSYGEVKAIATGDPGFLELAGLEDQASRLERTQRGHAREQAAAEARQRQLERRLARAESDIAELSPFAASVVAAHERDAPWSVEIGGELFDNRGDAARALARVLRYGTGAAFSFPQTGIDVMCRRRAYGEPNELVAKIGTNDAVVKVESYDHDALIGVLNRMSNAIDRLPRRFSELEGEVTDVALQVEQSRGNHRGEFPHAEELHSTKRAVTALRTELARRYGGEHEQEIAVGNADQNGVVRAEYVEPEVSIVGFSRLQAPVADANLTAGVPEPRSTITATPPSLGIG